MCVPGVVPVKANRSHINPARVLTADIRRGLVLVTKVLQNLANKVMFTKEPYMEEMNGFLKQHMDAIGDLFERFAVKAPRNKALLFPNLLIASSDRCRGSPTA